MSPLMVDGVQVYFTDDIDSQGIIYPETDQDGCPVVTLPIGTDPLPAVMKAHARWAELKQMDRQALALELLELLGKEEALKLIKVVSTGGAVLVRPRATGPAGREQ